MGSSSLRESLVDLVLEGNITFIGSSVFLQNDSSCPQFTSLQTISEAFSGCTHLVSVEFPSQLNTISYKAFTGCSSLSSITIPATISSIGESAFEQCSALTAISIPSSIGSVGTHAFRNCTRLASLTITASVSGLGEGFCNGCSAISDFSYLGTTTIVGGDNSMNFGNGTGVFETFGSVRRTTAWVLNFKRIIIHGNVAAGTY